jgi:hypothetical protein
MVWGAINEITAMNAYRRLSDLAGHPVLQTVADRDRAGRVDPFEFLLERRARETAGDEVFANLARFIIGKFWAPVGQGAKPQARRTTLWRRCFPAKKGWTCSIRRSESHRALARVSWFQGID